MDEMKIAVLGIGRYFSENRKYINPEIRFSYYLDNAQEKWGTCPFDDGVECISPESLTEIVDLVVVGVDRGEVRLRLMQQAESLGKRCISIDDLRDEYIDTWEMNRRKNNHLEVEELFSDKGKGHRIILLNTPEISSTIGDHAISVAERCFLKDRFPDREIIEIGDVFFWEHRKELYERIMPSDILLIQGGGYLGSLWKYRREYTVRYILQTYNENRIVILPQTMFFEDTDDGRTEQVISEAIYNSHPRLSVCFREKISFALSERIFGKNSSRYLIPDSVLSLRFTGEETERKGIAICFKNDKETLSTTDEQELLIRQLMDHGYEVKIISMFYPSQVSSTEEREKVVRDKMQELAGYELVITDAMHGMVLSAVSGTKCIGIETITGKVGGIYEWLNRLRYVKYVDRIDKVYETATELLMLEGSFSYKSESAYLDEKFELLERLIRGEA